MMLLPYTKYLEKSEVFGGSPEGFGGNNNHFLIQFYFLFFSIFSIMTFYNYSKYVKL